MFNNRATTRAPVGRCEGLASILAQVMPTSEDAEVQARAVASRLNNIGRHRVAERDPMWPALIARVIAIDYRVASDTLFAAFSMRSATARGCDT